MHVRELRASGSRRTLNGLVTGRGFGRWYRHGDPSWFFARVQIYKEIVATRSRLPAPAIRTINLVDHHHGRTRLPGLS